MTARSHVTPDSGTPTAVPALEPLLFELHRKGRAGGHVRANASGDDLLPPSFRRQRPPRLPELSELQVVRHFTHLAQLNYAVDTGMYPLGSCTMKYSPKVNDRAASLPGFSEIHPLQPDATVQGALALLYELERLLASITGMDAVTLQPAAGAQAEFTAILMFKAYHEARGDRKRRRVIVPDSAHGTNPASAAMCGLDVTTVRSDARGNVDLGALRDALGEDVVGLMLTNPNTLGLFEERVREVCAAVHEAGGLVYGDGANMNALLGIARPGDLGLDCVHINVHKTFSTPHGAGGPGAGPLCVKRQLEPYLPKPRITRGPDGSYYRDTSGTPDREPSGLGESIGRIHSNIGNFGVLVRAYTYIRTLGEDGLVQTGRDAILAANYLLALVREAYDVAYDRTPMHEFVLSAAKQKQKGASALDIAKALIDEGFHPPTVYFPLIVPEALMIEPTETEPRETLDAFAAALVRIAKRIEEDPASVRAAPMSAPLRRLDEVAAARRPVLRYRAG